MKRSTKIMSLILALAMAFSIITIAPLTVGAAQTHTIDKGPLGSSESAAQFQYRVLADGTAEITNCSNPDAHLVIPKDLDGYTVTSIGQEAFYGFTNIKSIRLPDTLTNISCTAFANCSGITCIIIPASVTNIGEDAFSGCSGVSCIKVADGNTVYDSRSECNAIIETASNTLITGCKATVIPDTVTAIGADAFCNSTNLAVMNIPDSVTDIASHAFCGCQNLTDVNIPASVTSIGKCAFAGCDSLTNLTVAPENPVYDSRDNCNAIIDTAANSLVIGCGSSTIPTTVTDIAPGAFQFCRTLKEITIPASVTSIGKCAFDSCSALQNVSISGSVNTIGESAFSFCRNLQNVTFGNGIQTIGDAAFEGCASLQNVVIPDSVTQIGQQAFQSCYDLTGVVIGSSVKTIGENAFFNCPKITKILIPGTVDYICDYAFGYVSNGSGGKCPIDNFMIYGAAGSAAHRYADANGFSFYELD